MSYNISTFKLKKIDNLKVPLELIYELLNTSLNYERIINRDNSITIEIMESTEITGTIHQDEFKLLDIKCYGEFSGNIMSELIEPLLRKSTGNLNVICVWEGGDIQSLEVSNGNVKWSDIE